MTCLRVLHSCVQQRYDDLEPLGSSESRKRERAQPPDETESRKERLKKPRSKLRQRPVPGERVRKDIEGRISPEERRKKARHRRRQKPVPGEKVRKSPEGAEQGGSKEIKKARVERSAAVSLDRRKLFAWRYFPSRRYFFTMQYLFMEI